MPYIVRAPPQRIVTDEVFDTVLQQATSASKHHQRLIVHLAAANLEFRHLQLLSSHFEHTGTYVFALDLSMNRIRADWSALNDVVNRLLGSNLVQLLDLGMNYLPNLSTLAVFPSIKQNFLNFGRRVSLALDCNTLNGIADHDWWVESARTFKREVYGVTEFAEDPDELCSRINL